MFLDYTKKAGTRLGNFNNYITKDLNRTLFYFDQILTINGKIISLILLDIFVQLYLSYFESKIFILGLAKRLKI